MSTTPSAASAGGQGLAPPVWREVTPGEETSPAPAPVPGLRPARPPRELSPVETTVALLRGRFTALVVWHLFWGGKRFYQLVRELPGVPRKALAHELEELERASVVARRVQGRGPGRVEYQLTALGESLKIVVGAMYEWGLLVRRRAKAPSSLAPSSADEDFE